VVSIRDGENSLAVDAHDGPSEHLAVAADQRQHRRNRPDEALVIEGARGQNHNSGITVLREATLVAEVVVTSNEHSVIAFGIGQDITGGRVGLDSKTWFLGDDCSSRGCLFRLLRL